MLLKNVNVTKIKLTFKMKFIFTNLKFELPNQPGVVTLECRRRRWRKKIWKIRCNNFYFFNKYVTCNFGQETYKKKLNKNYTNTHKKLEKSQ